MEKRKYSKYTDDEIADAIINTRNFMEAADLLDINRKTVQRVAWERGITGTGGKRLADPEEILNRVRLVRTPHIMRYVRKNNLLPYFCVECKCDGTWQGRDIVLELDHVDGDCLNNRLENLRWLCPNCHSQTPTYKNRNRL